MVRLALSLFLFLVSCGASFGEEPVDIDIPPTLQSHIAGIRALTLGGVNPEVTLDRIDDGLYRIRLRFQLEQTVNQDDWQIQIQPAFDPGFHWAPHLTPTEEHIIDQHSFRSPALVVSSSDKVLVVVPDLDILRQEPPVRWYMDLDARSETLTLGMSRYDVKEHVLYVRQPGAFYPPGKVEFGFYIKASTHPDDVMNPWRWVLSFLWDKWGKASFQKGEPLRPDLSPYVEHTYNWAFKGWERAVWQELELDGKRVGAPVFIVNQTQSPNYPGLVNEREFRSIWNQAWFSSLRSASGLYRHARRTGNAELMRRARMTKELALSAPLNKGLFPSVLATEMEEVTVGGETVNRSKGWGTAFWGNSDRNPISRPTKAPRSKDARIAPYHILDMSWTALLMLRWHDELEKDDRLVDYAKTYAERLVELQDDEGFFPAWLDMETQEPLTILAKSPETSMSVTFLLALAGLTGEAKYRAAALAAMDAVIDDIVFTGRWEDFETYWSCSSYGKESLIGRKVERNDMYKQNTFSMFWTTEALLASYEVTGDRRYLALGQRVLDELLMAQASWQPPYMYVNVLGGFGVMNADGEWNDSRESLFAEIIVRYGKELNNDEYIQRGLAALRSSFVMMYCPENPRTKVQWEKRHPFFGPEDYGFTMENYGHGGKTSPEGAGMGVFTIYDWGNGAAAEAYNRMLDHFGAELVHRSK
jgi:hypothetical protein